MWGWFIAVFAAVWLLQIMLAKVQMKNYQTTVKEMSNRPSGYLGVGVQKQKLGIGVIAIVVMDKEGIVVESRLMRGVTVFSRFEGFSKFNGLTLDELKNCLDNEPVDLAFKMAIGKIEAQMEKKINPAV